MSSERLSVVEFVGTPGSGKTTAAREMTSDAADARSGRGLDGQRGSATRGAHGARPVGAVVPSAWRGPLLWQVYRWYGWWGWRAFRRDHTALAAVAAGADRHAASWFARLAGRRRFLSRSPVPGEVLVVDDGFVHRAVALRATASGSPDLEAVARYVDLLEEPALVVYVRTGVDTCAGRVRERGLWPHRTGWTEEDLDRYLANAALVVQAAVTRARERGWTVVDADNEAVDLASLRPSLEAAAERLRPAGAVTGGAA